MAVDDRYIETVKNPEEFEDVLAEFGIEASFEQNDNGVDVSGYTTTMLRDMYNEDICTGRPVLSEIYKTEFTDKNTGETTTNWKIDLILFDDTYEDEKEAFIFPINLKSDDPLVKNVHSASGLYALAMGLMELKAKGIHQAYNQLNLVNIDNLRKIVKQYTSMEVKVVEKQFGDNYYNSFRIVSGEE